MKQVTNLLLIGLFVIFSAVFVTAAEVTIDTPATTSAWVTAAANVVMGSTFTGNNATNATYYTSTDSGTTWTLAFTHANTSVNQLLWNLTLTSTNFSVDLNHTVNITLFNGTSYYSASAATVQNIDSTVPIGHVQFLESDGTNFTSSLKSNWGADVQVNCTVLDAISSLDISKSYISIKYPGLASYSENLTLTKNTTAQVVATISGSDLQRLGEISIRCFSQDNAGNTLEKILNFSTQSFVVGAGSQAGGSGVAAIAGWSNPVGTIKIGSGTVSDGGRLTTEGESRLMKTNAAIKFDISGESHRIEVKTATGDSVVLTISSEPFDVTINAGEVEEVDINGDGIADLEVTYHKLFANAWADLTFKQISVPVEAEASNDGASADTTATADDTAEYADANGGLTVTLAVIVIILIIGYALIKGKKK